MMKTSVAAEEEEAVAEGKGQLAVVEEVVTRTEFATSLKAMMTTTTTRPIQSLPSVCRRKKTS